MLKSLAKVYQYIVYLGGCLKSPILLLCRLYWGWLFMKSGWDKLMDIDKFAGMLDNYGFFFPHAQALLASYTEFLGGICLMLGFASRLAAIPLIIVMMTAYFSVHNEAIRSLLTHPSQFVAEAPFNFLLTALIILAFGPGRFSVDYYIERHLFSRAEEIPKHQHMHFND